MWIHIHRRLSRSPTLRWAAGLALLAVIGWADHSTKIEYGFGLFYLVPISLMAWYAGLLPGLFMSAAAAGTWFIMDYADYRTLGSAFARLSLIYWNAFMAVGMFFIVSSVLAKLRKALEHEKEISRMRSDLLSMVSHEFNNSLTSMGMALLLLRENDADEAQRRKLYPVLERIHRILKSAVSNFLNHARLESGRFQLDLRQIELRKIVQEAFELMRPLSDQKNIDLRLDFPQTIFPVRADPDALALVMGNLIGNAIKYTPAKGRVTVSIAPQSGSPEEVLVAVEDTGIGIDPKHQAAIFQGFYRTPESRKEAKGFGVGLVIAKEILESHESALRLESAPGKGSRFYFTLPICPEDCPHRGAGPCHRCRSKNPRAQEELYDGGMAPRTPSS